MLKKSLFLCLMLFGIATSSMAQGSGMTDKQVMEYVETGLKQGKSQQQIATELARRGVTRAQAERVKKLYEQSQSSGKSAAATKTERQRTSTSTDLASDKEYVTSDFDFDNAGQEQKKVSRFVTSQDLTEGQTLTLKLDKNGNLVSDTLTIFKEETVEEQVFGRNIFNTKNLTFEPSTNLPTPVNYRLGAGDQVIIDIWGTHQVSIQETISPDGAISIENIGLVFLNGMTVNQATSYLKKELNKIYSGLSGENPTSHIKVSLGNSRTIQVNINMIKTPYKKFRTLYKLQFDSVAAGSI